MANMAILTTDQPTSEGGAGCPANCAWSGSEEKLFLLASPFIELPGGSGFLGPRKIGYGQQNTLKFNFTTIEAVGTEVAVAS
jgi:hypothetical protein